jgi:hypothetical protein
MPLTCSRASDARGLDAHEVEQQVGGQVAAGHDHVLGQLVHSQHPPDGRLHLRVGVAAARHAIRPAIDDADEAVAHVHARDRVEAMLLDGVVHAE